MLVSQIKYRTFSSSDGYWNKSIVLNYDSNSVNIHGEVLGKKGHVEIEVFWAIERAITKMLLKWALGDKVSYRFLIDTVNQGNWCLSIKLTLECFVIVA